MRMRYRRIALVVAAILVILAIEWVALSVWMDRSSDNPPPVSITSTTAPGGPFTLVDHRGREVTDADFRGKYVIMVFGYTFCPDVCPTTLSKVAVAMDLLGPKAENVVPVFVTVDPERDTPEVLAAYVAAFHPRMVGLTGSPAQIRRIAYNYRVYYAKSETDEADYLVDHSAYVYLIGPDGQMLSYLKHDATPEAMAAAITEVMARRTARAAPARAAAAVSGT